MNNTGNYNSGHYNSGDYNTGDYNTGDYNTGDCNSGHSNSGHSNSGNYNAGDYNTGNCNTGDCNTNSPTVRIFNKDSGWEFYSENHIRFRSIIAKYQKLKCEWVYEKNMSEKEKSENPSYKTTGGYLKANASTYNGKSVDEEDRKFLESVPNFCPKILKECTGIILEAKKKIVIDGKEIEISEESFNELKKQLIGE